jgi:hypothetical protein
MKYYKLLFSIFFGLAAASIGDYVKPVVTALDKMSHIILKGKLCDELCSIGVLSYCRCFRDFQELAITYFKFFGSFL